MARNSHETDRWSDIGKAWGIQQKIQAYHTVEVSFHLKKVIFVF